MKKSYFGTVIVMAVAIVLLAACGSTGPSAPREAQLPFDNAVLSMVYSVPPNAQYGTVQDAPGGGGFAYFISGAKTTIESGTYELLFSRDRPATPVDVRPYDFIVFEMMTDNLDLFADMGGHFPRVNNGDIYVQFNGTSQMQEALANAEVLQWVTIRTPIAATNVHENADEYRAVTPRVNGIRLRFILQDMYPIDGRIYIRNIRFE